MSADPPPSYAELAALVAEQAVLIGALRVELEALRRQVGRDSSNSSQPPSTDGPAARARAKAARQSADQQTEPSSEGQPAAAGPARARRKQGGQPGHRGSGLAPVATPDRREPVEPSCCDGCGAGLADAPATVGARVQVFDLPAFSLAVTEYQMMRRLCRVRQQEMNPVDTGAPSNVDIRSAVRSMLSTSWLASRVAAALTFGP